MSEPMTEDQAAIAWSDVLVPVRIELRSPFGEVLATFSLREMHGESGGMGSVGALMRAFEVREFNAPFVIPGMDERAPFYFHIERGIAGRSRFEPLPPEVRTSE